MISRFLGSLVAVLSLAPLAAPAQWVAVDTNYPQLAEDGRYVRAATFDSFGRAIIGGNFTNFGGLGLSNIARIDSDGTVDGAFRPAVSDPVQRLQALPDGRILVSGQFAKIAGAARPGLAILREDGTVDPVFVPPMAVDNSTVLGLGGADGSIWVWGNFTNVTGIPRNRLARFLPDGSLDPAFVSPFTPAQGGTVIAIQGDGRAIVAGSFSNAPAGLPPTGLLRLHTNGSVDTSFVSPLLPNVRASRGVLQADGRLVAAAAAGNEYMSTVPQRLIRVNTDGTLDPAFSVPIEGPGFPYSTVFIDLAAQPDGGILAVGTFLRIGGAARGKIARLLPDGSVDPCFELPFSANLTPLTVAVAPDGSALIGGNLGYFDDGKARRSLLRLVPPPGCERPGVIEFAVPSITLSHGELRATLPVIRHGARDLDQSVEFTTIDSSAVTGTDYQAASGWCAIPRGDRGGFISIPMVPSWGAARTNIFCVQLRSTSPDARLGGQTNLTVELIRTPAYHPGAADTNYVVKLDGSVQFVLPLGDGRAVIAGLFTNVNNEFCPNVARLRADGGRDNSFNRTNALSSSDTLTCAALDDAGRVVIGGYFRQVDNFYTPGLARLNPDGTLDTTFAPLASFPTNSYVAPTVTSLAVLADGSILCGAEIPDSDNSRVALLKFSAQGVLNQAFTNTLAFPTTPRALRALPDGRFLAIGSGMGHSLMLFNADGTLVRDFVAPADRDYGYGYGIQGAQRLPDGRLLINGFPSAFSGLLTVGPLSRFNPDGSLDHSFAAAPPDARGELGSIGAFALAPDSRAVIAAYTTNGSRTTLRRMNADGSRDFSFDDGSGFKPVTGSSSVYVRSVVEMPQGGWLAGGEFGGYNDFTQKHLVRVLADGPALPASFSLSPANIAIGETNTSIDLQILRRGDGTTEASVELRTLPGTALPNSDFLPIDTNLVFRPGEWLKNVPLTLLDDPQVEPTETFQVVLTNATGGYSISYGLLQVSILNDDASVEFIIPSMQAKEEAGFVFGAVRWQGAVKPGMRAQIQITPVIGQVSDLGATSIFVEYQSPSVTNTFRVPIVENSTHQPDRQFTLTLVPVSPNLTVGAVSNTTLILADGDFSTSPARGIAGVVHDLCPSLDGGVYVAGDFTGVHGVSRSNIARLHSDGEVELAFNPGAGPNGAVYRIALLPDGKVAMAGEFTAVAGTPRQNLARLKADGSLDLSFDPGTGPEVVSDMPWYPQVPLAGAAVVYDLRAGEDGTLYVAGSFNGFNGVRRPGLVRLLANGQVDFGFAPSIWEQPWRPIPLGGTSTFTALERSGDKLLALGMPAYSTSLLARYNPDGGFDPTFTRANVSGRSLAVTGEGLLLAGSAASTGEVLIRRHQTNGLSDPAFSVRGVPPLPSPFTEVRQMLVQADNRVLCSVALFQTNSPGTPTRAGQLAAAVVLRLLSDGQWDGSFPLLYCPVSLPAFASATWTENPALLGLNSTRYPGPCARMALQPDGILVLAGAFEEINGEPRHRLARLDLSGALRGRLRIEMTRSPRQLLLPAEVEQPYVIEFSDDLKAWHPWLINMYPWWPAAVALPTDDQIRFFRARSW